MLLPIVAALLAAVSTQEPVDEIKPLMDAGYAKYMHSDYDGARDLYQKAWELVDQTPPENPLRYDILKRLMAVRNAEGEFKDADHFLQMAMTWREITLGENDPKITEDLLLEISLCRGMKDYFRALALVNTVLGRHAKASGYESVDVADDYSRMAQVLLEQKKPEDAIRPINSALTIRTKLFGSLDASLVYDLDRLGATHTALRAYDKAEDAFRHALVIRESLYGKNHPDLIATVDGLAYAYFGQKKYDEAEPTYQRLISLWVTSVGSAEHPMVAMALDKVAIFYQEQKKYDQAKEASDRANAIRAKFLGNGLAEQAAEQMEEGNKDAAVALLRHALAALDPPNPIYDELHDQVEKLVNSIAPMSTRGLTKRTPVTAKKK
jgi:tetratricopeptide (TPR) repeat protein